MDRASSEVLEEAVNIAWLYLQRTGDLGDGRISKQHDRKNDASRPTKQDVSGEQGAYQIPGIHRAMLSFRVSAITDLPAWLAGYGPSDRRSACGFRSEETTIGMWRISAFMTLPLSAMIANME